MPRDDSILNNKSSKNYLGRTQKCQKTKKECGPYLPDNRDLLTLIF